MFKQLCNRFVVVVALLLSSACASAPDVAHPKAVSGPGFSFRVPGNWTAAQTKETADGQQTTTVTVEGKADSLMMLFAFEPAIPVDLDEFAAGMQTELTAQVQDKTSVGSVHLAKTKHDPTTEIQREIAGGTRLGRRMHWQISVLGTDVPHTIELYTLTSPTRSFVLFSQVPDEDAEQEKPGLAMVLDSLKLM